MAACWQALAVLRAALEPGVMILESIVDMKCIDVNIGACAQHPPFDTKV
jgi:hypothetical protein